MGLEWKLSLLKVIYNAREQINGPNRPLVVL